MLNRRSKRYDAILIPIDRISKLSIFSAEFNSSSKNESGNDKWSPRWGEWGEIEETIVQNRHRRSVSRVIWQCCHTRMDRDRGARDI